jgi:hypothetical protein
VTDFKTARGIMPNDPRVGAQTSRRLDDNLFVEPPELDPAFVHHGKILDGVTAVWPPLVTEDVFWTVQRILTDPARTTTGRTARYLLSHVVRCGVCGALIWRHLMNSGSFTRFAAELPNEYWEADVMHYGLADDGEAEIVSSLTTISCYALSLTALGLQ